MPDAARPDPNATQEAAVDRMREVAKWLIVILGAIGGTLIAGIQLTDVGSAKDAHLTDAVLGLGVSLAGVGLAIGFTVSVLIPTELTLPKLARASKWSPVKRLVKREPEVLFGHGPGIANLELARLGANAAAKAADAALAASPSNIRLKDELETALAERERVGGHVHRFLGFALVAQVRAKLNRALLAMLAGGIMAAAGMTLFAWASHSDQSATSSVETIPKRPSEATVALSKHGRAVLTKRLGDNCPDKKIAAIALGGEPDALDVVSVPTANCAATRFTLTEDMGVAYSEQPVEVEP
jgi:hypothetical protein